MEMQAEAGRKKRAQILESEEQAYINIADGKKSSVVLPSEPANRHINSLIWLCCANPLYDLQL
ncbi:hypothetical protein TanjilG_05840 [Lupinus angustifolius]|uniref:Uncharacterized protein n=1 Tax=Lupinus angustifolius TaxID=3871 RepID=A0A1J7GPT1_LUPAN|nr:hypothetical protein TanjilG_12826 [Lupinus angustifolius]OIW19495.1 hypothetical protein TanjilG_06950 [Lupinus angustifolius]OIW22076.1 hypothetical protein TanjilG_05840 [Lupinus angustifolius]